MATKVKNTKTNIPANPHTPHRSTRKSAMLAGLFFLTTIVSLAAFGLSLFNFITLQGTVKQYQKNIDAYFKSNTENINLNNAQIKCLAERASLDCPEVHELQK